VANLKCKFKFFETQKGKSSDPNRSRDSLFADPCFRPLSCFT